MFGKLRRRRECRGCSARCPPTSRAARPCGRPSGACRRRAPRSASCSRTCAGSSTRTTTRSCPAGRACRSSTPLPSGSGVTGMKPSRKYVSRPKTESRFAGSGDRCGRPTDPDRRPRRPCASSCWPSRTTSAAGTAAAATARPDRCGRWESCCREMACALDPTVGRGIVDGRHPAADRLGEDALTLQQRRHRRDHRAADRLALALIVDEEERVVLDERAAERAAELIAAVLRLGLERRLEEVRRVQRFVAEELEGVAVKRVGARLGRQVDDAAVEPAELGRRAVAFDLEFLNRVDDREERDLARLGLQHGDAVEEVFVGARPPAVDARQRRVGRQRDAGRERGQRDEAAAVQRQLQRPARCSTTVPRLAVSVRSSGASAVTVTCSRTSPTVSSKSSRIVSPVVSRMPVAPQRLEARQLDVDAIGAGRQSRHRVDALAAGRDRRAAGWSRRWSP